MKFSRPKIPKWIVDRLYEWNLIKNTPQPSKNKLVNEGRMNIPVRAFDTETLNGYVKLVATCNGKFLYFDTIEKDNIYHILAFLTKNEYRDTLNFFYNIDYDVSAIIKYLPKAKIKELMTFGWTTFDKYKIGYIAKKAFKIKKNKKIWYYFDLWQYYRMSLDKAAKIYLGGESKDPIDREKLGTDEQYWHKYKEDIIKYCIKDCKLTAKLAEILQQKLNTIGISFDKPFSTGTIAVRYFAQFYEWPQFVPTEWNKYAYLTYFGGRFEVIRKGYIDYVIIQDINSAYPYQIANLIDIKKGVWEHVCDFDENADVAFYKIIVEKTPDHPIQPFCFRDRGLVYYPEMKRTLHFVTQDELLFALDYYDDVEISVVDGWVFYAHEYVYPFAKVKDLYEERKRIKNKDLVMQLILKIIMNSLYGKNAEKNKNYWRCKMYEADHFIYIDKYVPLKTVLQPGRVFNPVYASLITARTRVMLLERAIKYPDHVVAMFTDSILSTKQIIKPSKELGGWDNEGEGEALIVGCGVYTVRDLNKGFVKTRLRGMHATNIVDLFEVAEQNKDKSAVKICWKKAVRPKEALTFHNKYDIDDINAFIRYAKTLHVRMDQKRLWFNDPATFGQLLADCYESDPLFVHF